MKNLIYIILIILFSKLSTTEVIGYLYYLEKDSVVTNQRLKPSRKIPTIASSNITGYLDALYQVDERFYIRGWACYKGLNKSINVHVYVDGSAHQGKRFVFDGTANQILDSKISNICNTVNIPHRFIIQIPNSIMKKHEGKSIIVHGIETSNRGQLSTELKITNNDRYTYKIPGIHPTVKEITDLKFHPLHYYSDAKNEIITNGQVYNKTTQSKVTDYKFSLNGAHSIASNGGSTFFATNTMVIKKDKHNKIKRDAKGGLIKSRVGAIVQINIDEGKTVASYKSNSSYSLFSPHDIIFNETDKYYYYIDSHWHSTSDYLVRFQNTGKKIINSEAIELNSLYPNQKIYARSLSIYQDGSTQKIMIGVSSHGQVILASSFSRSLSSTKFEIKKVTNRKRQYAIDKIGASGSYNTTGFVFNDVEFYKGYFYGTNFFQSKYCKRKGCADKFRFIRWKTWDDFEKDNIEDLSYLIQKKRIPYYISIANKNLYLATIPDNKALSKREKIEPKIYVISSN